MKMKRRLLIMASVVLIGSVILFMAFWHTKGPQIISAINDAVLAKAGQSLNGRLVAERLSYSVFGTSTIHNLVIYDARNNVIASCEEIALAIGLSDLLRGHISLEKIEGINLEGVRVNLIRDSAGRWNLQDLFKPEAGDDLQKFHGMLTIHRGVLSVSGTEGSKSIDQIEGTLTFASSPDIDTRLTGRLSDSTVVATGQWSSAGALKLKIQADRMEISQLLDFLPAVDKSLIKAGQAYDLSLTLRREKGPVETTFNAIFSGVSADFPGLKIGDMRGIVTYSDKVLAIQDAALTYAGQKLSARGKIDYQPAQPILELAISGNAFELEALSNTSPVRGTATFQSVVTGSPANPEIRGSFTVPSGTFDSTAFTDARGNFSYVKNMLTLDNVSLFSLGGTLNLSGTWDRVTDRFVQDITGQNIDAAALTGQTVLGPAEVKVRITGSMTAGSSVDGFFDMPAAVVNGTGLEDISGAFSKTGKTVEFSRLTFSAAKQKLNASGSLLFDSADPALNLRISSDAFELNKVWPDVPFDGPLAFQTVVGGTTKNYTIKGSFRSQSGKIADLSFAEAAGDFLIAGDALKFQTVRFTVVGDSGELQHLSAAGELLLDRNNPAMEFRLVSEGIDIAAVKKDSRIKGTLALQADVAGTVKDPSIAGAFQIPAGKLDALPFTDADATFRVANGLLILSDLRLTTLDGSIAATGTIATTGIYDLQINGMAIDVASLTAGDIKGRANFAALVKGKGDWNSAFAEGKITMSSGTLKTVAFSALSMDFRKTGKQIDVSKLDIRFLRGLVVGTGHTEGDYLLVKLTPATTRSSRIIGIGAFVLAGTNPLAAILGKTVSELLPLGVMKIRINGLENP